MQSSLFIVVTGLIGTNAMFRMYRAQNFRLLLMPRRLVMALPAAVRRQ